MSNIQGNTSQTRNTDYPLVIIGAGAAGLGASEKAKQEKIDHLVLEASHRIGGRGLTEYLEGTIPVDLGCHWMHCASKNPYVKWADKLGFEYQKDSDFNYTAFSGGKWLEKDQAHQIWNFIAQCNSNIIALYTESRESAIADGVDVESEWAPYAYYWYSLMHSNDVDQVSVQDLFDFDETHEDWPVKQGYGALIEKQGQNCPVQLNTQVSKIDWSSNSVKLTTNKGIITADKLIITVSTGVLASGEIEFYPELPESKQNAIYSLPLGNSNYQFFSVEKDAFDPGTPEMMKYIEDDISMLIHIQPFGAPCAYTSTGGRFAWWLEKQGTEASRSYFEKALVSVFGSNIRSRCREFKVSAWGYDPLIRGAYSSQKPGSVDQRKILKTPLNEMLYFAGEATSLDFLNTAHGAFISGQRAVEEVVNGVESIQFK